MHKQISLNYILAVVLLIAANPLVKAQDCQPGSPYYFSFSTITSSGIASKITGNPYTDKSAIDNVWQKMENCNAANQKKIEENFDRIIALNHDLNNLRVNKDIENLKKQIEEKKKRKAEIEKTKTEEMQNIGFKGLYLVTLEGFGVDVGKPQLEEMGKHAITPSAVGDLIGYYQQSVLTLENGSVVVDRLKEIVKGSMEISGDLLGQSRMKGSAFLRCVEVTVYPLKNALSGSSSSSYNTYKHNVVRMDGSRETASLQIFFKDQDELAEIKEKIRLRLAEAKSVNEQRALKSKELMKGMDSEQKEIDRQIAELESQIIKYDNNVSALFNKYGVKTVKELESLFTEMRTDMMNALDRLAENEFIKVTKTADYCDDRILNVCMADVIKEKATALNKDYSKKTNFYSELISNMGEVTSYSENLSNDFYRELSEFWVYIEPGDNQFKITLMGRFKKAANALKTEVKSGSSSSFPAPDNPNTFTDPRDGQTYKIVQIGKQRWFAENLRYAGSIPNITGDEQWANTKQPAWCHYDNNTANDAVYGKLYNWYAVNTGKLCPKGWHIPSDAEWTELTNYLGGEIAAGGKMKATTLWNSPNKNASNSSGFSALPGGYRSNYGNFSNIGNNGYFWSSTEYVAYNAWSRTLYYNYSFVSRDYNYKNNGFSCRCVRD